MATIPEQMRNLIIDVPDYPRPGVVFKDITPLLANQGLFRSAVAQMAYPWDYAGVTHVVGMESRGFIFGAPLATMLHAGFVPARKPGKLPRETHKRKYALEYGQDGLEIHKGTFQRGDRIIIADDLLATGGTALAVAEMVVEAAQEVGARLLGFSFFINLTALAGEVKLMNLFGHQNVHSVLTY